MRVEDSLQAATRGSTPRFSASATIVELARGPTPLLFLLDEILHGTNSYDRRIGAEAIVRALVDAGAIGLVTTHDLALTELAVDARRARRSTCTSRIGSRTARWCSTTGCGRASSSTATRWR